MDKGLGTITEVGFFWERSGDAQAVVSLGTWLEIQIPGPQPAESDSGAGHVPPDLQVVLLALGEPHLNGS